MKKLLALCLALSLLLALGACASIEDAPDAAGENYISGGLTPEAESASAPAAQPEETPKQTPAEKPEVTIHTPTLEERFMATWEYDTTQEAQQFSNDAGTSIDVLREEIGSADALFGVGYVGYFEYFEETGIDFAQWFEAAASPFAAYYPFFLEIDANHTIGESGYLYCILARDYDASIEVTDADGETLYFAANGDPILVFCNRGGDAQSADITLTITTADGTVCRYEPTLDELDYPQLLVGDERQLLSWIIQPAEESTLSFDALLAEGWLGVSEYGLGGDDWENAPTWSVFLWDEEKQTTVDFSLMFCPNPPASGAADGEAILQCFYENGVGAQAEWEGWWTLETELDQPSVLQLDLALMRGEDKAHYEAVPTLSETFWVMIHPNGEILLLIPQSGYSQLPFMGEGVPGVELTLAMG